MENSNEYKITGHIQEAASLTPYTMTLLYSLKQPFQVGLTGFYCIRQQRQEFTMSPTSTDTDSYHQEEANAYQENQNGPTTKPFKLIFKVAYKATDR